MEDSIHVNIRSRKGSKPICSKCGRKGAIYRELILNWFHAKGEISSGAVEGLNTNAKLAIRKARGFRTYEVMETALYHQLGRLPEPQLTHIFC